MICENAYKIYRGMKKELEVERQGLNSQICGTSDMWTSSQSLGYMSITAHYIKKTSSTRRESLVSTKSSIFTQDMQ
jgi:hypothetical protein